MECEINDPLPESHPNQGECRKMPVAAIIVCSGYQYFIRQCGHREHLFHQNRHSGLRRVHHRQKLAIIY